MVQRQDEKGLGIKIDVLDISRLVESEEKAIREVLQKAENATVFHSLEWNAVLAKEFGVRSKTLLVWVDGVPMGMYNYHTRQVGIYFKECRSPFSHLESVYGGPIAPPDNSMVLTALLRGVEEIERGAIYYMVTTPRYDPQMLAEMGYKYVPIYTSILSLQRTEEALWMGMDGKTRNMVRKAMKKGVSIVEGNAADVGTYYAMLAETLGRSGKHPLPQTYYERVVAQLGPKGMAKMLVAKYKDKIVAGAIFLCFKDTVYYWSGASFREYRDVAPNDLIQWEIIKWANANGYRYYDLLRIEPDRLPGIAVFKMGFGGNTVTLYSAVKRTALGQGVRIWQFITSPKKMLSRLNEGLGR
ncbi:MAG: GNAT family N-acetyltransferase [Candidatus Methanosuratincola sp.]|jgi:hypothetical protein|nr:GNAT family N-acetyltransferase [Candidatus Methanosuratincola sp.]